MKLGQRFTRKGIKYIFLGCKGVRWRVRKVGSKQTEYIVEDDALPVASIRPMPQPGSRNARLRLSKEAERMAQEQLYAAETLRKVVQVIDALNEWWKVEIVNLRRRLAGGKTTPDTVQRVLDCFADKAAKRLDVFSDASAQALTRYRSERDERRLRHEAELLEMTDPALRQLAIDFFGIEGSDDAQPAKDADDNIGKSGTVTYFRDGK